MQGSAFLKAANIASKIDADFVIDHYDGSLSLRGNFKDMHPEQKFALEQAGVNPENIKEERITLE